MSKWYSRPILCVTDVEQALRFYIDKLGFAEVWRHSDDGRASVAQVERDGTELMLSCQWPDKVGQALIFVSLDLEVLDAARAEFEAAGVQVTEGWWGYRLAIVTDPDGNQLLFSYPASEDA
jgi:uncharacterized glyoxalase superfamily protein PhnB